MRRQIRHLDAALARESGGTYLATLQKLSGVYVTMVHEALNAFGRVRAGDRAEPDAVLVLAAAIERGRTRVNEIVGELPATILAPGDLRERIERVERGLSYSDAWARIASYQLLALAVSFVLRSDVGRRHVGAYMGALVSAAGALARPWGPEQARASSAVEAQFDVLAFERAVNQEAEAALIALRRITGGKRRLPRAVRTIVSAEDGARDQDPDKDRSLHRATIDGVLDREAWKVAMGRWGELLLPEVYRQARDGQLNVAPLAVGSRLVDYTRAILRRQQHEDLHEDLVIKFVEEEETSKGLAVQQDSRWQHATGPREEARMLGLFGGDGDGRAAALELADRLRESFLVAHPEHAVGVTLLLSPEPQDVLVRQYGVSRQTLHSWRCRALAQIRAWRARCLSEDL